MKEKWGMGRRMEVILWGKLSRVAGGYILKGGSYDEGRRRGFREVINGKEWMRVDEVV